MNTLSALVTGLALASACPPPFNNPLFLDVNDTSVALDDFMLENGLGSIDAVSELGNPRQPWPWSNNQGTKGNQISYCFYSESERNDFEELIFGAWQLWSSKLGLAGPDTGHALRVGEFPWDADVPLDLRSSDRNGNYGRHMLLINKALAGGQGDSDYVKVVAHEWGHVFGLWHEHQRSDRDHYVRFDCQRIIGYGPAALKVLQDKKYTLDQLCNDPATAIAYNFPSWQFSLTPADSDGADWKFTQSAEYDLGSIMHYQSSAFANPNMPVGDPRFVPLAHWKQGGPDFQPPPLKPLPDAQLLEHILYRNEPSDLDVKAIKAIYPWQE
ncbi:hypothetical protein K491DRAFT_674091 [Lophiostoma macrostomum CBS 122681]|uniref:Metalloendopeptidase n=1 Tax=Lophiostoma macrostomum CBS 122681 TaxID=1314788 RepID=A0A6A6TMR2_9PLEO|nr:hypothetical protein K491DRAFT_674091 [Lophiostoma macrostomum CBS 122681]